MSKVKTPSTILALNPGWGIFTNDATQKQITNYLIEVVSVIYAHRIPEASPTTLIKLKMNFNDGNDNMFIVPLLELDKVNWVDKDMRCIHNEDIPRAKAQRHIANNIRKKLADPGVKTETQYRLSRVGLHIINGEPVFCTGGAVIRSPHVNTNELVIEPDKIPCTLDVDLDITEEEAVMDMLELISLFPDVGRILLAYNFLYLMRELYVYAWKAPRFCVYTYGQTDSRKTSFGAFISQLYNRSTGIKNPPRLDSSIPQSVQIIFSSSDCVHVFDDLCPSDSKDIQRHQEKTFYQIVRIIGDGIEPGRVKGFNIDMPPPRSGVILNGEYILGVDSDASRFLGINVEPPSKETLQRLVVFQKDKPLVVSTVYHYFIQWFISNYDWAKVFLREWWDVYSKADYVAFEGLKLHGRLKETHYYLNTAYIMFLEYCTEKGFIPESNAKELQQAFLELLSDLVGAQQMRVEQCKLNSESRPSVQVDYLSYIRKLYLDGTIRLAPSVKDFNDETHDGVVHLGRLFIYGESFRRIFDDANHKDVLDELEAQGALFLGSEGRNVQIYVNAKRKPRGYAILLTHLT